MTERAIRLMDDGEPLVVQPSKAAPPQTREEQLAAVGEALRAAVAAATERYQSLGLTVPPSLTDLGELRVDMGGEQVVTVHYLRPRPPYYSYANHSLEWPTQTLDSTAEWRRMADEVLRAVGLPAVMISGTDTTLNADAPEVRDVQPVFHAQAQTDVAQYASSGEPTIRHDSADTRSAPVIRNPNRVSLLKRLFGAVNTEGS